MARTFRHHSIARLALASLVAIVVLLAGSVATAQAVEANPAGGTAAQQDAAAGAGAGAGA